VEFQKEDKVIFKTNKKEYTGWVFGYDKETNHYAIKFENVYGKLQTVTVKENKLRYFKFEDRFKIGDYIQHNMRNCIVDLEILNLTKDYKDDIILMCRVENPEYYKDKLLLNSDIVLIKKENPHKKSNRGNK